MTMGAHVELFNPLNASALKELLRTKLPATTAVNEEADGSEAGGLGMKEDGNEEEDGEVEDKGQVRQSLFAFVLLKILLLETFSSF